MPGAKTTISMVSGVLPIFIAGKSRAVARMLPDEYARGKALRYGRRIRFQGRNNDYAAAGSAWFRVEGMDQRPNIGGTPKRD